MSAPDDEGGTGGCGGCGDCGVATEGEAEADADADADAGDGAGAGDLEQAAAMADIVANPNQLNT